MIDKKRQNTLDGVENIIIGLYGKGMSVSHIEEQISELYDFTLSTSAISRITDKINADIVAWKNRPLDPCYLIVWIELSSRLEKILKSLTKPFT